MVHRVCAALTVVLAVAFCSWILMIRNRRSLFDLCQLHVLGYLPFTVLGLLTFDFVYSRPTAGDFWMIALASVAALALGVWTYLAVARRGQRSSTQPPEADRRSVLCAIAAVWAVGVCGYALRILFSGGSLREFLVAIYSNRAQLEDTVTVGPLSQICGAAFFIALASVLLARRSARGRAGFLLVIMFLVTGATEAYLCLTSLNRSRFAIDLLAILFICSACGLVVKKRWIVLGGAAMVAIVLVVNPIVLGIRSLGWYEYLSVGAETTMTSTLTSGQSVGGIDFFLFIRDTIPRNHPYMSGKTFVPILLVFIPRVFWPGKPQPFGRYVWSDLIGELSPNGVGPTFIGEAYANAGWIGILVFAAGLGAFLAVVERWIAKRPSLHERISLKACILFWWSAMLVRGDMHTCMVFGGISMVTAWLGFRLGNVWSRFVRHSGVGSLR